MALADSSSAIGAVSELLRVRLTAATSAGGVDIGRPESAVAAAGPKFNLFLYQIDLDGHMRNFPLDQGQPPPLWLVLRYLLTAIDGDRESDSVAAHELLGEGMLALQGLNFIRSVAPALGDNPEPLKITFDIADAELLGKIMQGSDERYRLSAAFQVRPVMIVPSQPPVYALPVTSVGPPAAEGVLVIPSLGPRLDDIEPRRFEAGAAVTVLGTDLGSEVGEICFGDTCFGVSAAPPGRLTTVVPLDTSLSAGSYAVTAVRTLPSGRRMASNAVLGRLLPSVETAAHGPLANSGGNLSGNLNLTGRLLGGPDDAIFVAFYRDGAVVRMLEPTGTLAQTALTVSVPPDAALPPGLYRIILRVNGEQAPASPEVDWS